MKQQLAAVIVTVALCGGAGTGYAVRETRAETEKPVAKPSPAATTTQATKEPAKTTQAPQQPVRTTPAPPPAPSLLSLSSLQIGTGSIGPVKVGMTSEAAADTGYFETEVEACGGALQWKTDYAAVIDVAVAGGIVTSMGVRAPGPRTVSGLGVGSTFATVRGVVGAESVAEPAGAGQSGLFVTDGAGWIGFLFDAAPEAVTDETPVTYIEVTSGARPDLVRNGC
ncbi:hypothetical protein [Aeromicrobium stalagmiti]|uniref:hypothetical protein n=1 Tax=Aeromicrobium stalagmiti TaxID=2738988 RepID=UPI001567F6A2|nr:hypothetical protein [Aeromicrobium stalagmiti]NRQ49418.1 hypothetical protein [Aeromicrobium stalagmiti]